MKNCQKTIIFIEPPGNIQKELHAIRFSCAKMTLTASILTFPDLIPLTMLRAGEQQDLSYIETLVRGKIHITMQPMYIQDWLFLPTNVDCNKLTPQQELSIPSWQFGYITLGPKTILSGITDFLASKTSLSFSAGRLLLSDVMFLNNEGTSYSIEIREALFRKKT